MIDPAVLARATDLARDYQGAKPFRHLCIESFLVAADAEQALQDFPAFDEKKAMNEFGLVGGKAVVTDMGSISPFYARLRDVVCGDVFLKQLSAITGVADLKADPNFYGGGTHENRNGQELDPHIDFNYDPANKRHRRMNLLIYLNKEWDKAWGGDIELHSDPRKPAENRVISFAPAFNRAVVFETNEHSWHGFPRIQLPTDKLHVSRKCISLYFYTDTRPATEIAPPHYTHYIPRPLPAEIATTGRTLSETDAQHILRVERERDRWIEFYQKLEVRQSGEIEQLKAELAHARSSSLPGLAKRAVRRLGRMLKGSST